MSDVDTILAAIQKGDPGALEEVLAARPEAAAASDANGMSLVLQALYHRRPAMAERLAAGREGDLDLLEAAALGRAEGVRRRLDADPGGYAARSPDGFTALHYAAFFGRPEVAELLLTGGAEVDPVAANPTRVRPLHSAVAGGHAAVVERLLAAGADANARQQGGFTPLMGAAAGGSEGIVEQLLAAGADPSLATDDGKTAADLAAERGHPHLAARLRAPAQPT